MNQFIKFETPIGILEVEIGMVELPHWQKGTSIRQGYVVRGENENGDTIEDLHLGINNVYISKDYPDWIHIEADDDHYGGAYYKIVKE